MTFAARIAVAILSTAAAFAHAQAPAPPPAKIADAAWLQGYWRAEGFEREGDDGLSVRLSIRGKDGTRHQVMNFRKRAL